jgi:hypothetical protein
MTYYLGGCSSGQPQPPVAAAAMFPSELERLIFEEAAVNDKQTALRLALVSRQVQAWSVMS